MATDREYTDFTGCLHVHFSFRGRRGGPEFLASEAEAAGLDFLFLTPHTPHRAGPRGYFSWDGYHGSVLLFAGEEADEKSRLNHLLIWGRKEWSGRRPLDEVERDLARCGAFAAIAHPRGRHRLFLRKADHRWNRPVPACAAAIEVWSLLFDWARRTHPANVPVRYAGFPANIEGPDAGSLGFWDATLARRRITGLAGLDIHTLPFPLGFFDFGKKFEFRFVFSVLRNHVLARGRKSMDAAADQAAVIEGIRAGRVWFADDRLADSRGFFLGSADGIRTMGDAFFAGEPVKVRIPERAKIVVKKNGTTFAEMEGREMEFSPDAPGAYRVEVKYRNAPWIFANPIFVEGGEE